MPRRPGAALVSSGFTYSHYLGNTRGCSEISTPAVVSLERLQSTPVHARYLRLRVEVRGVIGTFDDGDHWRRGPMRSYGTPVYGRHDGLGLYTIQVRDPVVFWAHERRHQCAQRRVLACPVSIQLVLELDSTQSNLTNLGYG